MIKDRKERRQSGLQTRGRQTGLSNGCRGFYSRPSAQIKQELAVEKCVGQASNLGPVDSRLWCPPWPAFVVLCDGRQEDAGDLLGTHQRHPSPASLVHTSPTGRQGQHQQRKGKRKKAHSVSWKRHKKTTGRKNIKKTRHTYLRPYNRKQMTLDRR